MRDARVRTLRGADCLGECVVAKIRWSLIADDRELHALKVYADPGVTEPPGILDLYAFNPSHRARRTPRRAATAD